MKAMGEKLRKTVRKSVGKEVMKLLNDYGVEIIGARRGQTR